MNRNQPIVSLPQGSRRHVPATIAITLLLLFPLLSACAAPSPTPSSASPSAPDATYQTRGIVRKLPIGDTSSDIGGELVIAHEAIPEFINQEGETVGMSAMTMPFHVASAEGIAGITVGDRVALTFGVRWSDGRPLEVLEIEPLDAAQRLDFERPVAEPEPAPEPPSGE